MTTHHYFYDDNQIRYTLAQSNGGKALNWLLLPGGAGVGACYLQPLIDSIHLPGNVWLVDFPHNGNYFPFEDDNYDFNQWFDLFEPMLKKFPNPVVLGHSFGSMFPLFFESCENLLKGAILMSGGSKLWNAEAKVYAKQFDLPDYTEDVNAFRENPNQATFDKLFDTCMPYYFVPEYLEEGKKAILKEPFNYKAAVWWQNVANNTPFDAKWVPSQLPTLIINGSHDAIVPPTIFNNDPRFNRPNIEQHVVQDAGHFPWFEKPKELARLIKAFTDKLND